eukprot:scaffold1007_cov176-Amphora_coffeaeformis.AAC.20
MEFEWRIRSYEDLWSTFFAELKIYMNQNGHCGVPRKYVSTSGYVLGDAVYYVRKGRRFINGHPERVEMLNELGFDWTLRNESDWLNVIGRLNEFEEHEGHLNVENKFNCTDGFPLGRVVSQIRTQGKYASANPERRKTLEQIGFIWDVQEIKWQRVQHLYKTEDGYGLGVYISKVRGEGKYISPTADRQFPRRLKTLLDMGFTWNCRSSKKDDIIRAKHERAVYEMEELLECGETGQRDA